LTLEEGPDLERLNDNKPDPNGPKAMIGAGTGMGHGFMAKNSGFKYFEVYPSEGGHCDFAPQSDMQYEYLKYCK
jgi:glucokinase